MKYVIIQNIMIKIVERLDSFSSYSDNYYKIKSSVGDYYNFFGNDVMRIQSYDEFEESIYIGKFVDGKFIPALMISRDSRYN